jgi:hypothetical protein
VPEVADLAHPTQAELDAGTELTSFLMEPDRFPIVLDPTIILADGSPRGWRRWLRLPWRRF